MRKIEKINFENYTKNQIVTISDKYGFDKYGDEIKDEYNDFIFCFESLEIIADWAFSHELFYNIKTKLGYALYELLSLLKDSKPTIVYDKMNSIEVVENQNSLLMNELISCKKAFSISEDRQFVLNRVMEMFNIIKSCLIKEKPNNGENAYKIIKKEYGKMTSNFKNMVAKTSDKLSNVFHFVEEAFDEGEEMLILVTELTISTYGSRFISRYGCKEYFMHNKELLFYERQKDLIKEIEGIDLEGLE